MHISPKFKVGDKITATWVDPVGQTIRTEGEVLEMVGSNYRISTRFGYARVIAEERLEALA